MSVQGLQERPPLIILYKGHRLARALLEQNSIRFDFSSIQFDSISARARIVVRIRVRFQLKLELWLEFVSKFELLGIRNRIEMAARVGFDSIAKVSKTIRN